jgi:hypothetical protein
VEDGPIKRSFSRPVLNRRFFEKAWIILIGLSFFSCSAYKYSGLLSWEEYAGSPEKEPYVLELAAKNGRLLYYGAYHSVEVTNSQFADLEVRWAEFQPSLALSEGGIWPLEESREEAISKHGEQGLLRFLAARDGIQIQCLDPPLLLQAKHLRNFFPAREIKIYIILRQARINRMLGRDSEDMSFYKNFLTTLESFRTFRFPPHTIADLEKMVAQLFPQLEDWRLISDDYFFRPETGKFLPGIHKQLMAYRDQHMLGMLIKKVREGRKVFAVVGRRHVIMQEPVLRSRLSSPK